MKKFVIFILAFAPAAHSFEFNVEILYHDNEKKIYELNEKKIVNIDTKTKELACVGKKDPIKNEKGSETGKTFELQQAYILCRETKSDYTHLVNTVCTGQPGDLPATLQIVKGIGGKSVKETKLVLSCKN